MMSTPTDVMAFELASKRSVEDVKKPSSRCWMLSHPVPAAAATSPRPSKAESVPRTSITSPRSASGERSQWLQAAG